MFGGENMADGNTVDSLQIEIEAASSEAEKKVDALAAALERLKKTTTGFGSVSSRIKDIGASANEAPAAEKTRKRKEALDRATGLMVASKNGGFKADKISRELNRVDKEIEKTTEKLLYLQEKSDDLDLFRGVGSIESQSEASSKIKDIEYQLDQYSKLQDSLDAQRRSLLKSLEGENNQPIKENIDSGSIDEATKKVNSLKQAIKELDRGKLQLTNELAKAEIQAVKTDGKLADLRRKIDDLKEKGAGSIAKNALQDAEDRFSKFSDTAAKTKEKIETLQKALEILNSKKIDLSAPGMEDEIRESSQELKRLIQLYRDANNAAKLAGEEMKNSMAAVNAAMKSSAGKATKGKAAKEKNIIGRPEDSGVEQVESETSLQKKLGIIQKISETISKMTGQKLNIGSVEGLKGLLGKDLSLQSLIPKGAEAGLKAMEGALGGLKDKMLGIAAAHPILAAALVGVNVAAKTVGKAMKDLAKSAYSAAKKGFELLAAGAKKLGSALKNLVTTGIGKAVSGLKSVGKSVVSSFTKPFTNALAAYNKWKSAIGRIAFYRAVRGAIKALTDGFKTGIENLYQYSRLVNTEFAPAMDRLATSSLYLKNSLGAMAAPLIQALAPAVDFLIDKFVALINIIGKAFAVLTGKSVYTQAKKHAVEYKDAANAASKATQKFLLGIDELTILENPAGGAGSALEDYGSMFEEVEIDQDQFDWVKQIREAIEKGEWRSVGELIADKLNEIVDSWDSYAWGEKLGRLINNGLNVAYGFLTKFDFVKFGSKIADGLNGIFDTVDWDLLGRTFAAKWNALFNFIYGFATTLKWHEIGLDISQAINGFLDELDASKAAQAVSSFATGLFDMLNTAIAETNWNVLGDKLGQFISEVDWQGAIYGALSIITNGLAALKDGIDGFLQSWNWQDTAQKTYTAVNQAFSDVDWDGLGVTLSNAFTTAFNFLRETIAGIEWDSIGSDVAAFLNGIDWASLLSSVATTIATAFNTVVETLSALVRDLKWEEVGRSVGNAINDFFSTFDWVSFFTGLAELASGVMNGISVALETIDWDTAWASVKDGLDAVDWGSLVESAGRLIVDAFVTKLKLKIIEGKAFFSIGGDIIAGLFEGIGSAIAGVGEWLKTNLVDPIVNGVKGLFGIHSPSTVFAEIGGNLIAGLLGGISEAWDGIVEFFGEKLGALKESISKKWDEMKQAASEKWENIKTTLGTTWDNIKASASEKFSSIKENISEKWENVKKDTSEKWENVKTTLSDAWENMKTTASEKVSEIKENVSSKWSDIVSSAASWGSDLCSNLASGINKGISWVTNAVSSVANSVKSFLHFSEPDIGPLSDFHTYMPDMMSLMSKGIKDNAYKAIDAANDVARSMSMALGDIEPVEPKFTAHENILASINPEFGSGRDATANVATDDGQSQNSLEIVNAIFAIGQQIVTAISENGDRPINLDWASMASGMTTMQNRQNMMYGRTLQNA